MNVVLPERRERAVLVELADGRRMLSPALTPRRAGHDTFAVRRLIWHLEHLPREAWFEVEVPEWLGGRAVDDIVGVRNVGLPPGFVPD